MSSDFYSKVAQLSSEGKPFAIATVVRVAGSSSARRGSKAIIDSQGKMVMGWVGGGCAEGAVKNVALACIEQERSELITLDMQDEVLGVGMPCGGMMDIFIEPVLPKPEVLILGHGRIAETLSRLAHLMGFLVVVNDPMAERQSFPDADRLVTTDFNFSETPIPKNSYVVIATLHKNDHVWLERALESEAAYIALIASRHRADIVFDYVASAGVPAEKLERVSGIIASAIIACVLPVRTRIREDTPPLALWERSDRIARCDPGEGLRTIEGPGPLTPTLSHKGRGRSPRLATDRAMR